MSLEKGDRVMANRDLGFLSGVRKGDEGVVTDVSSWTGRVDVDFADGEVHRDLTEGEDVSKLSGSDIGGGCLVALTGMTLLLLLGSRAHGRNG